MKIQRITSAEPHSLNPAGEALYSAFLDEYIIKAINGDDANAREIAPMRYRGVMRHAIMDLETWGAFAEESDPVAPGSERTGPIDGIMVVKLPGVDMGNTPNKDTPERAEVNKIASEGMQQGVKDMLAIEGALEDKTWINPPMKDIYFVHMLGTAQWARGLGVAKALLSPLLERAEREGMEVGLITHTPQNVKYYQRYGFEVRETIKGKIRGVDTEYWSLSKMPSKRT